MGFYAPAQVVRDAREHGVEAREVDVNLSDWDCTLEGASSGSGPALRLGLRQIDGLQEEEATKIVAPRGHASLFTHTHDLWLRAGVKLGTLEKLAAADAFRSLGLDRRQALWEVKSGSGSAEPLPLFTWSETREAGLEPAVALPAMPLSEHVVNDYQTLRLSLKAHPMSFLRAHFAEKRVRSCDELRASKDGAYVSVAGVVLVRQRPGSAKGVVFMTIEDETGIANAVVWPKTLERFRKVVMGARLIVIHGRIQRHEDIVHVVSQRLEDRSDWLKLLSEDGLAMKAPVANADHVKSPDIRSEQSGPHNGHPRWSQTPRDPRRTHPRNARIIPKSRDFH